MKINLNTPLLDLAGAPMADQTQGKLLAGTIANGSAPDPLKFWGWATKLYAGEEIEIDQSDYEALTKFVKENPALTVAGKAQILQTLIKCKG